MFTCVLRCFSYLLFFTIYQILHHLINLCSFLRAVSQHVKTENHCTKHLLVPSELHLHPANKTSIKPRDSLPDLITQQSRWLCYKIARSIFSYTKFHFIYTKKPGITTTRHTSTCYNSYSTLPSFDTCFSF